RPTTGARLPSSLRIEGPSSIAPAASAQYRAIASFADGSVRDVTTEARWRTFDGELSAVVVDTPGTVSGRSPGEADLTAYYPATQSTPDGELVLPGTVS